MCIADTARPWFDLCQKEAANVAPETGADARVVHVTIDGLPSRAMAATGRKCLFAGPKSSRSRLRQAVTASDVR